MKRLFAVLIILFFALNLSAEKTTSKSFKYYLLTDNASELSDFARTYAEKNGGYIKYYSYKSVILRVPEKAVPGFKKTLPAGTYLIDEQVSSNDLTERISELKTRLAVKQKMLQQFYALFRESQLNQTLDVEKEITKLVMEIEKLKGTLAYLTDRIKLSEVRVYINVQRQNKQSKTVRWHWVKDLGVPVMLNNWREEK